MKVSAAFLSNDTVCHFSSHIRFKSVFLSESMTVEFEQEKFYFEYKEKWYITYHNKTYALVMNDVLELCIHDFSTVSIQLVEWKAKWHQTAAIPFDQKVLIGSGIGCDGIVDGCFPVKLIEFVKRGSQVNYMVYSGRKCAVNGKLSALKGTINAPSLIQVDQLSVFLGDKAVVFNCAAVISDDVLLMNEPDLFIAERNIPRYFPCDQIRALTLKEPEFLSLPAVRGISIFTMGPMLTMSAASLLSAYFSYMNSGNQNVLVMPVMMLFSSLFWPLTNVLFDAFKLYQLKKRRRKQYIKECSDLMELVSKTKIQVQQSIVSPEQLKPHEVWQIRQGHPQFLKVPIGKGKMLSGWTLKSASKCPDVSETECLDQRARLIEKMKLIEDVIVSCDLNVYPRIAFVSHQSMLNEVVKTVVFRTGLLMDIHEVSYVLFCDDESISWDLRMTELFRFEKKRLIVDESVSNMEIEALLHKMDTNKTIVFSLGTRRISKLSNSLRKKLKIVYFLDLSEAVPKECSCIYHVNQNGNVKEGNFQLLYSEGIEEMKKMLMKLRRFHEHDAVHQVNGFLPRSFSSETIIERWKNSSDPCAVLGLGDQEAIVLNLSEHHHGPHGLVAGMTGSGKSVLLLDLLLSLALECSPEKLQILILDYKGGTLIQQLQYKGKVLPHLCGGLSNQTNMISRALASIQYEALDRQKCFIQASHVSKRSVSNLEEYRKVQKGYSSLKNLAELVIVVDEFAELKKEEPDFLKTLISLARTGRSLGFHLILCTQKISGVVDDEIIGNSRFHLVLKTSRASESRELTGTDAAASFKQPGEFLLHVDDTVQKGKAFNCLAPADAIAKSETVLIDSCGFVKKTSAVSEMNGKSQSEVLIEVLCEAAEKLNVSVNPLWLKPLSVFDASKWLKKDLLFLGIGDFPEIRDQNPVYLQRHQHLLIGYEDGKQRKGILTFFIKQLLCLEMNVYFVQLVSKLIDQSLCIGPYGDQMSRFIKKMASFQDEHTVIVIDDLQEFAEYFVSSSALCSFIFKAVQHNIQIIALCHRPFSASQNVMDQFERKMIFANLQDTECMQLFHIRKENCRLQLKSQAFMEINEKLHAVQLGTLAKGLKERSQLLTIDYLADVVKRPQGMTGVLGINADTLKPVETRNKAWIVTGTNKSKLMDYCRLIQIEAVIVDHVELLERHTRKTIRDENVLWIGPQFQYQNLFLYEPKQKIPSSFQEGMVIHNGIMELVRLYDE